MLLDWELANNTSTKTIKIIPSRKLLDSVTCDEELVVQTAILLLFFYSPTPRTYSRLSTTGLLVSGKSAPMSLLLLLFCLLSTIIQESKNMSHSNRFTVKGFLHFTLRLNACNVEGPVVILRIEHKGDILPECSSYYCKSVQFMYYTCSL